MNYAEIDAVTSEIASVVREAIAAATAPLIAQIGEVKAENATLAARLEIAERREFPTFDASPIEERIKALEARPEPQEPERLPDIPSLVREAVSGAVMVVEASAVERAQEAVTAAVEALPKPQDGRDGRDADPAEMDALREEIATVKASIPAAPNEPDLSGFATKADLDAVAARIVEPKSYDAEIERLAQRIGDIKSPEVIHGRDGDWPTEFRQNADGELIVKMKSGETHNAGTVRGADGLGFDDLSVEYDGERTFSFIFAKGDRVDRREFRLPVMLDRGVWKEGTTYEQGDVVSWAGSMWVAQKDTDGKPDGGDFRLSVKKGRDGKPGTLPAPRPETVKR